MLANLTIFHMTYSDVFLETLQILSDDGRILKFYLVEKMRIEALCLDETIIQAISNLQTTQQKAVPATIIRTEGSTSCKRKGILHKI